LSSFLSGSCTMGALTTPIGRSCHGEHLLDGFLCQRGRGVNEKMAQWAPPVAFRED
jgi:hypothetical protein